MDRFVAFFWDWRREDCSDQVGRWSHNLQTRSKGWTLVVDRPGLSVFVLPDRAGKVRAAPMASVDGVVIGSLFERGREQGGRVERISPQTIDRIAATSGRLLLSEYWGSYVALWREPQSGAIQILRDPCGAVSCFRTRAQDVEILCSCVADVAAFPGLRFSIAWEAVHAFLLHNYFITHRTGLNEIQEILPGQRMTWRPDGPPDFAWVWNPVDLALEPRRQTFEGARKELFETAEACFLAWGNSFHDIAVRISGGLDSAIVANLVRRACSGRVIGIHFVGRGYEAFERRLARLAAQRAGVELIEIDMDRTATDFPAIVDAPLLARPTKQILGASADAILTQALGSLGVASVMGGHGGDGLFLQRSIAGDAFADYVRLNGVGRDFWRVAYETATLVERPVWRVLKEAVAYRVGVRTWDPLGFLKGVQADRRGILSARIAAAISSAGLTHPWLVEAKHLPPCKAEQLRGIVALRNYHSVLGHGLEYDAVHPFISQPIVEFAIRTPAYLCGHGGVDRALERSAFASVIPGEIARRVQKGFINHQISQEIVRDAAMLREFVLEGHIVAQGGVDREQVERLFTDERIARGDGLEPLMNLIAAEAWLTPWRRKAGIVLS